MVPRPGDVPAEDGELVTQDGILDLHRFTIAAPHQAEEPAKDQVEDRYEHEAAMVPMRWSAGESLFWHLSPNANAFCERWVDTVTAECLDWTLVLGRRHLERVLRTYIAHYNEARPHRGLDLRTPIGNPSPAAGDLRVAGVRRRDVLGGLVHEYCAAA